jgi:2-oxoglutarate dehydrogenase E1 component
VVAETLNLSKISGYRVGGTIHLIINNQVGYTTSPEHSRSSPYPTDVAKMVQAPIFHVNGDDPEACVRVARWAFAYRQAFRKDVVIDMYCYRRHGHNEGDDPSYTQPLMYQRIDAHPPVREKYVEALLKRGDITAQDAEAAVAVHEQRLQAVLDQTRASAPDHVAKARPPVPFRADFRPVSTGVDQEVLDRVHAALYAWPEDFTVHPKLARQFDGRRELYESGEVDWGLAETLAYGSLILDGTSVRLTGEDTRRGTFAHRHAVLIDYHDEREFIPLQHLADDQGRFWVYDSMLSEYAAIGLEYGYSVANREALVLWEAQFGDFVNGAQIIIDQYLAAGEDKWNQRSGLGLLLPHGFEGQGPEHSSARIERFLTLCADGNMVLAQPTTSAQFFHLLRRQALTGNERPLVVFTPKSLLRARQARSPIDDLVEGHFCEVLDDPDVAEPDSVRAVVLCSGKVAHAAVQRRDEAELPAAVVRVEQLYPFPGDPLSEVVTRYPNAERIVWLQEEPANMGAWTFLVSRHAPLPLPLSLVSRPESGSPACGSLSVHNQEFEQLMIDLEKAVKS